MEPELLVLDDPAAELDPAGADALFALLPAVARRGAAVLVATPDLERAGAVGGPGARARRRADRCGTARPARVLDDTDVARVARAARLPGAAARSTCAAAVARLVR